MAVKTEHVITGGKDDFKLFEIGRRAFVLDPNLAPVEAVGLEQAIAEASVVRSLPLRADRVELCHFIGSAIVDR